MKGTFTTTSPRIRTQDIISGNTDLQLLSGLLKQIDLGDNLMNVLAAGVLSGNSIILQIDKSQLERDQEKYGSNLQFWMKYNEWQSTVGQLLLQLSGQGDAVNLADLNDQFQLFSTEELKELEELERVDSEEAIGSETQQAGVDAVAINQSTELRNSSTEEKEFFRNCFDRLRLEGNSKRATIFRAWRTLFVHTANAVDKFLRTIFDTRMFQITGHAANGFQRYFLIIEQIFAFLNNTTVQTSIFDDFTQIDTTKEIQCVVVTKEELKESWIPELVSEMPVIANNIGKQSQKICIDYLRHGHCKQTNKACRYLHVQPHSIMEKVCPWKAIGVQCKFRKVYHTSSKRCYDVCPFNHLDDETEFMYLATKQNELLNSD